MNNIPNWVSKAIFYQIFPDRFATLNQNPKLKLEAWNLEPTHNGFKGGNIKGVISKIDYLKDLGINTIYFNPIFSSPANHRYHTSDYYKVDEIFGTKKEFINLIKILHKNKIKLILDGVFNHTSRAFYQFNHVLENFEKSPYVNWYYFNSEKLINHELKPYSNQSSNDAKKNFGYSAWYNLASLPKLNLNNPEVQNYIFDVATYWLKLGIDGWRLDVPFEIKNMNFWRNFRKLVKSINSQAYLVGEIWHRADKWLKGDIFDAVMNYNLGKTIISYFLTNNINEKALNGCEYKKDLKRSMSTKFFTKQVVKTMNLYDEKIIKSQMNLLTSHDTPRLISIANNNLKLVKLAYAFMFFCPGAPCIMYGDEIGIKGYNEPDCRKAFNWNKSSWNQDLLNFIKELIRIRKKYKVLSDGSIKCLKIQNDTSVWLRENKGNYFVFAFNRSNKTENICFTYNNINFNFIIDAFSYAWKFKTLAN